MTTRDDDGSDDDGVGSVGGSGSGSGSGSDRTSDGAFIEVVEGDEVI